MSKIIEFKDLNYTFKNGLGFNDFNLSIEEGSIVSLIGPSCSGKTTLLKMLCHKLPNENCQYKGVDFNKVSIDTLRKEVVVVFDEDITCQTIKGELTKYLKLLSYSTEVIEERYEHVKKMFNLGSLEEMNMEQLPYCKENLIKILRYLILDLTFIAIDNIFTNLSEEDKTKVIKYIKEKKMTLLNVVTDLDDTLYGNKICVIENFIIIMEGSTASVLKTDTLLKRLGFTLPLQVDLSIELIHYDVLNKVYTDRDKLVGALWK